MVHSRMLLAAGALLFGLGACNDGPGGPGNPLAELMCDLDSRFFTSGGVGRDVIPALTDPVLVPADDPSSYDYLSPDDRVIGFFLDGEPVAVPHNILWHHEITNLNGAQEQVAVTYCPLTGTSLIFDRTSVGGAEFGVSGLLFQANLIMYDRNDEDSLWPQMLAEARCGPRSGSALRQVAMFEMTWAGWEALHPETRVVASPAGIQSYDASSYPYGNYESLANEDFLGFPIPAPDERLAAKARVFGIPGDDGGVSLPFDELDLLGARAAVEVTVDGATAVVFWDGAKRGASAFSPDVDGTALSFSVVGDQYQDDETGSVWTLTGEAITGVHVGRVLTPIETSYVAFWGAWSNFNPTAELWLAP